jgi:hypothetical protein
MNLIFYDIGAAGSIPEHWKKLLHRVEPAAKGIPHFKNVYAECSKFPIIPI